MTERRAFSCQPDPTRQYFVQPKGVKLVRRGPRAYSILWRTPDGKDAETPIAGGVRFNAS